VRRSGRDRSRYLAAVWQRHQLADATYRNVASFGPAQPAGSSVEGKLSRNESLPGYPGIPLYSPWDHAIRPCARLPQEGSISSSRGLGPTRALAHLDGSRQSMRRFNSLQFPRWESQSPLSRFCAMANIKLASSNRIAIRICPRSEIRFKAE
jgi:hypothetical protein